MSSPIIVWAFLNVILFIALVICIMLLKDKRNKQFLYKRFEKDLSECIVVLSQKMEFLYGLPMFMSDPLYIQLSLGHSFADIVGLNYWNRMKIFFDEIEKHLDMSFVFSVSFSKNNEHAENSWYEMKASIDRVNAEEYYYVCFIKNISKENENRKEKEDLQDRFNSLLQNTGDFMWNFDIESREMRLLTPMMDDEHRVIPQSIGYVNIRKMMPESDYFLFDKIMNERVRDYKKIGFRGDPFETIKIRFYGYNKTLVWYGLRGKLRLDENERLIFQGTARCMDVVLDNPVFGNVRDTDVMLSAALAFPDIRILWIDKNYKIVGCNQAFATDFQIISVYEIYGKNLNQIISQDLLPYFSKIISEVFDSGRSVSWKGVFGKSQRVLMFNAVPLKDVNSNVYNVLLVYLLLDGNDFTDVI